MPDAKVRQIKINRTHVRGAFTQKGVIADKMIQLSFRLKEEDARTYSHEFYQVQGLYVPIILGADFLGKHGIPIVCGRSNPIVPKEAPKRKKKLTAARTRSIARRIRRAATKRTNRGISKIKF